MAMFFPCQACIQTSTVTGGCVKSVFYCTTMRNFNERCKSFDPLCNPLATAWVAATTVCQQRLFTGLEPMIDPTGLTGLTTTCNNVPSIPGDANYNSLVSIYS
jgi:hypothetical protein